MPPERAEQLHRWHQDASTELHERGARDVDYLGLRLHVPEQVFAPTPTSDLLGRQVLANVRPGDRVLDMGCGAGANALLAALTTDDVVAVDVNPHAVAATARNAEQNGVASRIRCFESDVFTNVNGEFDIVVIDPPFRWFVARDLLDRACTDENYETLRRFLTEVPSHLRVGGFVLLFFGTSGDVVYLDELIGQAGLASRTIDERTIRVRGVDTTYFVRRLDAPP
jgi:release factor glutamine methyltransferase